MVIFTDAGLSHVFRGLEAPALCTLVLGSIFPGSYFVSCLHNSIFLHGAPVLSHAESTLVRLELYTTRTPLLRNARLE
ncbi:hypothetical protein BJX99DRAFT_231196 [Aspergillus californicus]